MWLWLEAMTMAFSLDMVLGFLFITLFVLGGRTSFGRLDRDNSEENLPDLVPW